MSGSTRRNALPIILLILAVEGIFFLPFVIPRVFRPTVLNYFIITNLELGAYFSLYGVVALLSYVAGGWLADRFESRNLMAGALTLTASGGFAVAFWPNSTILPFVYGFWGFTTIFLFWAAMLRATRVWGGNSFQGRAFGFLESGRGFVSALIALAAVLILSGEHMGEVDFRSVVIFTSVVVLAIGLLVLFLFPSNSREVDSEKIEILKGFKILLKNPELWKLSLIVLCAYVGYKTTDDISLFANDVLGFNEAEAAGLATAAL